MEFRRQGLGAWVVILVGVSAGLVVAKPTPKGMSEDFEFLLEDHCYDCHDDTNAKGGLDLYSMPLDLADPDNLATWAHVWDRIESGEMPPKKKDRIPVAEQAVVLGELESALLKADRTAVAKEGRVRGRRLTRVEYEHTVHDLLGIQIPVASQLPADDTGEGFETVAEAQQLSHYHLKKYLEAADLAVGEALNRVQRGDHKYKRIFRAEELTKAIESFGSNYRGPEGRNGKVYSWNRKIQFNGKMAATRVPKTGWYEVTMHQLQGINPGPDGAVWGTLQSSGGFAREPVRYIGGVIEGTATPQDLSFVIWIREGHLLEVKPDEGGTKQVFAKSRKGEYFKGRDLEKEGIPGLAFDKVTIERVYPSGSRWELRKMVLPGVEFKDGEPVLAEPKSEIGRLVSIFADRAFRRPVTDEQLAPYLGLALERYEETEDFFEALREAYRAVLCSPRFLTFVEAPGTLDDHAVASRLSYLLWSSMPDAHLRKLADEGHLLKGEVLKRQVDRMLLDPKAKRFIENFTDQWLSLKEIDFTQPDPKRFREFDKVVEVSMLEETRAFVHELIRKDLSVRHFIQSDFAMLNTRLQTHYGFSDLKLEIGEGVQKVPMPSKYRSGLVTQGSILKVTADGSVTSPVVRGVWVGERILGLHIPPPPANVPAVEPDIRGAVSIRDQLEKHKSQESCAACHVKIDPPGFALESYDPVGRWREYYGVSKKSAKVDPSGVTPDGLKFRNVDGWKQIYTKQPELLADAFARQLLTYGTGASIRFGDRPAIEKIVSKAKAGDYGVRSLIQEAVASDVFLSK